MNSPCSSNTIDHVRTDHSSVEQPDWKTEKVVTQHSADPSWMPGPVPAASIRWSITTELVQAYTYCAIIRLCLFLKCSCSIMRSSLLHHRLHICKELLLCPVDSDHTSHCIPADARPIAFVMEDFLGSVTGTTKTLERNDSRFSLDSCTTRETTRRIWEVEDSMRSREIGTDCEGIESKENGVLKM